MLLWTLVPVILRRKKLTVCVSEDVNALEDRIFFLSFRKSWGNIQKLIA